MPTPQRYTDRQRDLFVTAGTQGQDSGLYKARADRPNQAVQFDVSMVSAMGVHVRSEFGEVYFCDEEKRIFRSNLDGSNMTTLYSYEGSPSGIDFDPSRKKIYWADYELDAIFRGDLNGEHIETLVTDVEDVFDVKLHINADGSGHFFFSSPKKNAIYMADIDGGHPHLFIQGVSSTRGIALHQESGRIFWADSSDLYAGNITTGENREHIASGFGSILFIEIDHYDGRLYVADYEGNAIYSMGLDGSDIRKAMNVTSPRAVAIYTNVTRNEHS